MLKKRKKLVKSDMWDQDLMFGPKVSFAVSEAYKLLRANVMYSFSSQNSCHVIGVMSSVRGEGKSTTAANLAYAFAEADKKTLLIEADLRLPTIAEKLDLNPMPGLTDMLVMYEKLGNVLQNSKYSTNMDIITAGRFTPNPSELLGSPLMNELFEELKKYYEYIIVDMPPVTAVSDALVISKLLDGAVMVVRRSYVTRKELAEAMRQLKMVDVRLLGFVYRGMSNEKSAKYAKARYYHKKGYGK